MATDLSTFSASASSFTTPLPLPDIRGQLLARLMRLPYSSFIRCLADLLERMGYADVKLSSRKDWRGRNGKDGSGGFDLTARLTIAGVSRRVLIIAKQFDEKQRVYLSQVDTLRGVCLRAGATEGLLITTGPVSSRIPLSLLSATAFAPVRILGCEELLDLLITHGVGVWKEKTGTETDQETEQYGYGLDRAYFADLASERRGNQGNSRVDSFTSSKSPDVATAPEFLVTVAIAPIQRGKIVVAGASGASGAPGAPSANPPAS